MADNPRPPYATLTLRKPRIGSLDGDPRTALVELLQYRLRKWPYGRKIRVDGEFGPLTAEATQKALWYLGEEKPFCRPAITPRQLLYVMGDRKRPAEWVIRARYRHGKPVDESIAYDAPSMGSDFSIFVPDIVARESWAQYGPRYRWYERKIGDSWTDPTLFIHYIGPGSAARGGVNAERARIQSFLRYHMQVHGWSDLGYHWFIGRSGVIFEGRSTQRSGAHSGVNWANRNPGVCLDHGADDIARGNHVTQEQVRSLVWLYRELGARKAMGHREVLSTSCPGDPLQRFISSNRTLDPNRINWSGLPSVAND